MTTIKFDPFRGFDGLAKKMNTMMNDLDKGVNLEFGSFAPRVDIIEDEQKLHFDFELAGVSKSDVKVTINDENVLVVKGTKTRNKKTETNNSYDAEKQVSNDKTKDDSYFLKVERNFGEFTRSFVLPDNINKDSISAKFDNGVLNLTFDKMSPEKPKIKEITID